MSPPNSLYDTGSTTTKKENDENQFGQNLFGEYIPFLLLK